MSSNRKARYESPGPNQKAFIRRVLDRKGAMTPQEKSALYSGKGAYTYKNHGSKKGPK